MGKLDCNELLNCRGGNILTTFTGIFISVINVVKKFKFVLGGKR